MESTYFVGFAVAIGVLLVLSVLITLYCGSRLNRLQDLCIRLNNELAEKAPPKQLEKALATAEGASGRVDTAVLQIEKYKDEVHREMQRFYAIMRRQEKTREKETTAESESEIPDEVAVSALKPQVAEGEEISKAELRRMAREAGL